MGSPGKRAGPGDEELETLMSVERSPAFDKALARLLAAHHADILQARCGLNAEVADPTCRASKACSSRACLGVAERRGAERKGPDKPVGPQLSSECEHEGVFTTSSHGADGLDSKRQADDLACARSNLPSERFQFGDAVPEGRLSKESAEKDLKSINNIVDTIMSSQVAGQIAGHGWLSNFVGGAKFEIGTAIVLLLFCLVTALEMQGQGMRLGYELRYTGYADPAGSGWPEVTGFLRILSVCFGGAFALEVLLRVVAAKQQFLLDWWNIFDVIMLAGWFVELTGVELNSKILRLVRLVRVLRFLRLVKIAKYLENLYFMVRAINGCWRALGWSSALLLALQAFTACVISQILFTTYFPDEGRPIEERREVFLYFGSFVRSLLTTFEMTMGNWPTPARVLFENVSEWFMWVFLLHKLIVGFAFVGVINAMFVQETFQVAMTDDLSMVLKKQRHMHTQKVKLEKLFSAADSDSDGRVSRTEFARILRHDDVRLWLASMDYDPKDPNYLFDLLDQNDSGDLSATEFLKGMLQLRGFARAMDLLHLSKEQEHHVENIMARSSTGVGLLIQPVGADHHDDFSDDVEGLLKV